MQTQARGGFPWIPPPRPELPYSFSMAMGTVRLSLAIVAFRSTYAGQEKTLQKALLSYLTRACNALPPETTIPWELLGT